VPHAILDDTGAVVGRITLNTIVRGPFQSCSVGYWLSEDRTGRGLATQAVDEIVSLAFDTLGLHRVEAGTLVDNVASQRVLARTGFERIGLAPAYLKIAGRWQDHVLFQRINAAAD
jgi:ribosomal-protein-alanine N-acetyltransferase